MTFINVRSYDASGVQESLSLDAMTGKGDVVLVGGPFLQELKCGYDGGFKKPCRWIPIAARGRPRACGGAVS